MKTDNELIAEFMGATVQHLEAVGENWCSGLAYRSSDLKYHTSWDWTVPACRKLISDLLVLIDRLQKQDTIDGDALHEAKRLKANLAHQIACLDLSRVHAALVEGIRWYNEQ